jgi:hypothetical protein
MIYDGSGTSTQLGQRYGGGTQPPTLTPANQLTQQQNGGTLSNPYLTLRTPTSSTTTKPAITPPTTSQTGLPGVSSLPGAAGGPSGVPQIAPPAPGITPAAQLPGRTGNTLPNINMGMAEAPLLTPGPGAPAAQGAPPPQAAGGSAPQTTGSNALSNLGDVLSQHLADPSRFDLPEVQKAYDFFKTDLTNQAKLADAQATGDASARGVYYGSPLTTSLGDISTQLQRGLGALSTNIGLEQAQTQGQDLTAALAQGLQFGGQAMTGQNLAFNQALQAASFGEYGVPTMTGMFGGALGAMSPMLAYGQYNPQMFQSIGASLAGV